MYLLIELIQLIQRQDVQIGQTLIFSITALNLLVFPFLYISLQDPCSLRFVKSSDFQNLRGIKPTVGLAPHYGNPFYHPVQEKIKMSSEERGKRNYTSHIQVRHCMLPVAHAIQWPKSWTRIRETHLEDLTIVVHLGHHESTIRRSSYSEFQLIGQY